MEAGETPQEGIAREVMEETALTVEFALESLDLKRVGRADGKPLFRYAVLVAHAHHVLPGKAQRGGEERGFSPLDDQVVLGDSSVVVVHGDDGDA